MKGRYFRIYGRLLRFLRPHLRFLLTAIVFMAGFAALSGLSLTMIKPFTEIVLSGQEPTEILSAQVPGAEEIVGESAAPMEVDPDGGLFARATLAKNKIETRFYRLLQGSDRQSTLNRLCLSIFLVFLLKNLFWYAQSYLIVRVEQNVIRDIRDRVFSHYQSLSQDYFSASHSGVLISRITNDVDLVRGAIANGIADLVRQSLLLLVYLTTVLLASWQLFLVAILVLPPNLWLIDRIGSTLRRASRVSQSRMARLTTVLTESLTGMRIVKAFGLERERTDRFATETDSYAHTMIRMTRIGSLASPLTEILGVGVACIILWYAGSRVATDPSQSGRFMLFLVGMLAMMQPIKLLSQVNMKIQQGLAAAERIFEVLDSAPTVAEPSDPVSLPDFDEALRFEDVTFSYRPDTPVLQNIELEIPKGAVVALVGPSGGGKSTLVDLIPRFYDPSKGRITIDGRDLRDIRISDLRKEIGIVTQETHLFEGSVNHNIAMGRLDASADDVEAAARAANAHEFIERLPQGYDTEIGERGQLLSGGQRQRLSIARAILKNPSILIFDEATSALDTESERLVQEAIEHLLQNRTAVVVAHRLSTIRSADVILVIADGKIVERGRHEALMENAGLYRRLYNLQFEGSETS